MNENLNLCELLKGYEGETFYSPIFGDCELFEINKELRRPIKVEACNTIFYFCINGI